MLSSFRLRCCTFCKLHYDTLVSKEHEFFFLIQLCRAVLSLCSAKCQRLSWSGPPSILSPGKNLKRFLRKAVPWQTMGIVSGHHAPKIQSAREPRGRRWYWIDSTSIPGCSKCQQWCKNRYLVSDGEGFECEVSWGNICWVCQQNLRSSWQRLLADCGCRWKLPSTCQEERKVWIIERCIVRGRKFILCLIIHDVIDYCASQVVAQR